MDKNIMQQLHDLFEKEDHSMPEFTKEVRERILGIDKDDDPKDSLLLNIRKKFQEKKD